MKYGESSSSKYGKIVPTGKHHASFGIEIAYVMINTLHYNLRIDHWRAIIDFSSKHDNGPAKCFSERLRMATA